MSELPENTKAPKSFGNSVKVIVAVLCLAIFIVLAVVLVPRLFDTGEGGGEGEQSWQEELVSRMQTLEAEWGEEEVADWEEKKIFPLDYTLPYSAYEVGRYTPNEPVLVIGDETLYSSDFNAELFLNHYPDFSSAGPISDEVILEVADSLIRSSVILQEASEMGLVELGDSYYGESLKDFVERGSMVEESETGIQETGYSVTSMEKIAVWFYNMEPPAQGVEAAREIAEDKITGLYSQITAGDMTFNEAGDEILSDAVLSEIDYGIEGNAYTDYTFHGSALDVFHDPDLAKEIDALPVGEISEVIVGRDKDEEGWYDAFFTVFKINERQEGFKDYEDWLSGKTAEYQIRVAY